MEAENETAVLTDRQRKELLEEIDYNRKNCFLSDKTELLMQIAEAALNGVTDGQNLPSAPVGSVAENELSAVERKAATVVQPKVIELPKSERLDGNGYGYYFDMNDVFEALDAAGAKYKVNQWTS